MCTQCMYWHYLEDKDINYLQTALEISDKKRNKKEYTSDNFTVWTHQKTQK